jgi:hypothetical protein
MKKQMIELPPPINQNMADTLNQNILCECEKAARVIAMRKAKLDVVLKKGYVTVWD